MLEAARPSKEGLQSAAVRVVRVRFKTRFVRQLEFLSTDMVGMVRDLFVTGVAAPPEEQPHRLGPMMSGLYAELPIPSMTRH